MKTLIVPMADSTQFANKPRWLATHPSGYFSAIQSIMGLPLDQFEQIYFVTHESFEIRNRFSKGFEEGLNELGLYDKSHIVLLDSETNSQPETVYKCIKKMKIDGFVMVKDVDNYFEYPQQYLSKIENEENHICCFDLTTMKMAGIKNKSYLSIDNMETVTNIVENKIISSIFSVGGYAFKSADEFCNIHEHLYISNEMLYISNIIFEMILRGKIFTNVSVNNYYDWSTIENWNEYKSQYLTLFVDLDGTLVENSSYLFPPYIGNTDPLYHNIYTLRNLYNDRKGMIKIIITTSRPDRYREITVNQLKEFDIPYDLLIMDLPHTSKRIIINDFSPSNPYPSCESINIKRDGGLIYEFINGDII